MTHPAPALLLRSLRTLGTLSAMLALAACGGNDDNTGTAPAASPAAAPPAPAAAATVVSGSVVKGPVAGAQVCGYMVSGSGRGAALGSCTTSDASGNYTLTVPVGSGLLWVEASGGSYVDETTRATVSLPAGSVLVGLVGATGGSVTGMLTPLTTLALNAARATAGSGGTLDAAAYAAAAAQLLATFNLPPSLNITTTLPTFGSAANAYGSALTTFSQMLAAGLPLAQLLATTQPALLQPAYAAALAAASAPPAAPPPAPPPATAASASASGNVAVAGGRTDFAPQTDGFEVGVKADRTNYRFYRRASQAGSTVIHTEEIIVSVPRSGATTVTYADTTARFTEHYCFSACGVTISTPAGASHPVTITFAGLVLSNGRTLTGSLVGDAGGAAWGALDLPRTTSGTLDISGTAVTVVEGSQSSQVIGAATLRSVSLSLADGSQMAVNRLGSDAPTVLRAVPPGIGQMCNSACQTSIVDSAAGTTVTFSATPLSGGVLLSGSVFIGMTSGSVTSAELGGFTPTADSIESHNDQRRITFSALGSAGNGIATLSVSHRGGRVVGAEVSTGIGAAAYVCIEVAAAGLPACAGITVAADGRSVTLANTVLTGSAVGAARSNVTLSGSLVAKGL